MDLTAVAGMIFSLLVIMLIGGFILFFPVTLRLGRVLEQWLADRKQRQVEGSELRQLRDVVAALQGEVERLAERQEFVENVLGTPGEGRGELPAPASEPPP